MVFEVPGVDEAADVVGEVAENVKVMPSRCSRLPLIASVGPLVVRGR